MGEGVRSKVSHGNAVRTYLCVVLILAAQEAAVNDGKPFELSP